MARLVLILVLILSTSLLAAACGGGGESLVDAQLPDAPPRQTIMEGLLLAPNEITEGIMTGGGGDLAAIHLAPAVAGGEIDWNIHGHANGGTQIIHEGFDLPSLDYTFAPAAKADWYLLIRNSGLTDMTIQVKVELYGDMQWRWQ